MELIMYIGIIGMIIGIVMVLCISRNKLTNGSDIPFIAKIGMVIFLVSVILAIVGGFCSSELLKRFLN